MQLLLCPLRTVQCVLFNLQPAHRNVFVVCKHVKHACRLSCLCVRVKRVSQRSPKKKNHRFFCYGCELSTMQRNVNFHAYPKNNIAPWLHDVVFGNERDSRKTMVETAATNKKLQCVRNVRTPRRRGRTIWFKDETWPLRHEDLVFSFFK